MALKIVTGGTDAAQDGTLVSSGNKITFTQLNTNVTVHMRCDDGYYSTNQTFTLPQYVSISFDNGSTWSTSANNPISAPEIEDINYKILLKQTQGVANTSSSMTTDGSYSAITQLSTPTLTAGGGDTVVNLSWTAVSNRQYYVVQRATNSGFTTGVTTLKAVSDAYTSTTLQDTGRSNGTTYYYRVMATGIGRYSDSAYSSVQSATPTAAFTVDTFTEGSNGVALTSHTPTYSGNWTNHASWTSSSASIYSNRAAMGTVESVVYHSYAVPSRSTTTWSVTADIVYVSANSGSYAGLWVGVPGSKQGYICYWYGGSWALGLYDGATYDSQTYSGSFTEGQTISAKLQLTSTQVILYLDTVARITWNQTTCTPTRLGIYGQLPDATKGFHIDNLVFGG